MTGVEDKRIAELLRQDAPPVRDPLFRISVLQRREHESFRRRSLLLFGAGLIAAVVLAVGIVIGETAAPAAAALVLVAGLGVLGFLYAPMLAKVFQRFRI